MILSYDLTPPSVLRTLTKFYSDKQIEITLPFGESPIGSIAPLSQLLIGVLRSNSGISLKCTYVDDCRSTELLKLINDPISLLSSMMTANVSGKNNSDLKTLMVRPYVDTMFEGRFLTTPNLVMGIAVDHSVLEYSYPSCFYNRTELGIILKGSSHYSTTLKNLLEDNYSTVGDIDDYGNLIYELICNTEEHAKVKFTNGETNRSIRALVIRVIPLDASTEVIKDDSSISEYVTSLKDKSEIKAVLEISVIDTGDGLVSGYYNEPKPVSYLEELDLLIRNPFGKTGGNGISSKPYPTGYGRGLRNVTDVVYNNDCHMSVRTGKVLLDMNGFISGSVIPQVTGTAYTVLVPLKMAE